MRALALDVGEKRIGVAMSDPLGITAQPVTTIHRKIRRDDIAQIVDIIKTNGVDTVVCGLPKNMDGSEGFQAEETRLFAQALKEASGMEVVFVDERLTTASARRTLIEGGVRRDKRKGVIDKIAAVYILETYLARQR
ncbi:MAG: Holliday junction resolvase RuvX [Clostridiales bacterium]|nr:Holliday junction resolvase RuvX [Clostridiales bacterium]MBQ2818212.1 Holliday junction resolvase RuvX [Clostridia bacterium]